MTLGDALAVLAPHLGGTLRVHANGYISRAACAARDDDGCFYMIGSMGLASSIGLGLALAQPARRVLVLDGDGNVLMNPGALASIAADPDRYDMVITDHTMPQLTGLALAREIAGVRPGLPVILYTGYAEDLSAKELLEAGVLRLVRKPIEPAQLYPLLAANLLGRH